MKLSELKAIAAKRTKGEWVALETTCGDFYIDTVTSSVAILDENDAAFIAAASNHFDKLIAVAQAAASLMSEDDAQEALAHFNCLHILRDALVALETI